MRVIIAQLGLKNTAYQHYSKSSRNEFAMSSGKNTKSVHMWVTETK